MQKLGNLTAGQAKGKCVVSAFCITWLVWCVWKPPFLLFQYSVSSWRRIASKQILAITLHSWDEEGKHYVSMAYLKVSKEKQKKTEQVIVSCTFLLIPLKYIIRFCPEQIPGPCPKRLFGIYRLYLCRSFVLIACFVFMVCKLLKPLIL